MVRGPIRSPRHFQLRQDCTANWFPRHATRERVGSGPDVYSCAGSRDRRLSCGDGRVSALARRVACLAGRRPIEEGPGCRNGVSDT